MSAWVVWPGTVIELRRLALDNVQVNVARDRNLELLSVGASPTAKLAVGQAGWFLVSTDGGLNWTPLGTDPQAGVELGPLIDGERKAFRLRCLIPGGTQVRQRSVALLVGEGS